MPLLAQCPAAIRAGTTISGIVANLDIAPTFLEAAGVAVPTGLDGRSVWPLLQGKGAAPREEVYQPTAQTRHRCPAPNRCGVVDFTGPGCTLEA